MTPLPLTGERTVPGAAREGYWFARHEVVYSWLGARTRPGQRWLDAGSGEGYGADLLTARGAQVTGVELDAPTAAHAARRYPRVDLVRANLVALPFADKSFDVVVSLQVIEHVWDVRQYLAELARVCRAGGTAYLSTPNRPVFSPGLARGARPTNPFHVEEFDAEQLVELLREHGFADPEVRGLHHGPRITKWEHAHGSLVDAQVEAAVAGEWPAQLEEFVATMRPSDFVITEKTDTAQDLVAIGSVE